MEHVVETTKTKSNARLGKDKEELYATHKKLHGGKPIILLAEDNVDTVYHVTKALRSCNCSFRFAQDGNQAVDRLLYSPFIDLAVMDFLLPGMDAEQVLTYVDQSIEKDMRSMYFGRDAPLPVIIMSACDLSAKIWPEYKHFKIQDVWEKPLKSEDVYFRARRLVA